jgi:hypothetical protein
MSELDSDARDKEKAKKEQVKKQAVRWRFWKYWTAALIRKIQISGIRKKKKAKDILGLSTLFYGT